MSFIKHIRIAIIIVCFVGLNSFTIFTQNILVDGDFEGHSSSGCSFNLNNIAFNGFFSDLNSFGPVGEICIMEGQCAYGSAPISGSTKLGMADSDAFSMSLNTPIIGNENYTLNGFLDSRDDFQAGKGLLVIGVSNSANLQGVIVGSIAGPLGTVGWDEFNLNFTAPVGTWNYLTISGDKSPESSWTHIDDFNLSTTQTQDRLDIPTMGEWGLIILSLLILIVAASSFCSDQSVLKATL